MSVGDFLGGEDGGSGKIDGVRIGLVVDNMDPMELGRVKVTFPWRMDMGESPWAPVATPMAYEESGTYFIPDEGEQVVVAFAGGYVTQPIVMGSIWSQEVRPPAAQAGEDAIRGIFSRNGHHLLFDDTPGEGLINIMTNGGHEITLSETAGEEFISISDPAGNAVLINTAEGSVEVNAMSDLSLSAQNIELSAAESLTLDTAGELTLAGDAVDIAGAGDLSLESGGAMNMEAGMEMSMSASMAMTLEALLIMLN